MITEKTPFSPAIPPVYAKSFRSSMASASVSAENRNRPEEE
jgi:hypothetical protein